MTVHSVVVREYARLTTERLDNLSIENTLDRAQISQSAFDWICKLNQRFGACGTSLVIVEGRTWLKLDKHVGVIETPCGTRIEILPKHHETGDVVHESRALLQRMIATSFNLPTREVGPADLRLFNAPLTEWIMGRFLAALEHLVKTGIRFDYTRVEKEQRFLRGQLDTVRQMRQPPGRQHFFQIRHDVFDPNGAENRLLKLALELVSKSTRDSTNWKLAGELRSLMREICSSKDVKQDFKQWRDERLMGHYRPIRPWCELILGQQMPMSVAGNWRGLSLLFPMDKLFEKYVAAWLRRSVPASIHLRSPATSEYLTVHDGDKMFRLEPDLLLESDTEKWVLDTKWKKLDATDRGNKYKLSQDDFYQLFAYGKKYLAGQEQSELVLIYPATTLFCKSLPVFDLGEGMKLWVLPFDLNDQNLIDSEKSSLPIRFAALDKQAA